MSQHMQDETGWRAATPALRNLTLSLLAVALLAGACRADSTTDDAQPLSQNEEAVAEEIETSGPPYQSHTEAAIAAAVAQDPELEEPAVIRSTVLFTDETTIDLRVQVIAEDYCHWFGVVGRHDPEAIGWRSGPAGSCEN